MAVKKPLPKNTRTFDLILSDGIRKGQIPARTQAARNWFRERAKMTIVNPSQLIREDRERLKNKAKLNEMFFFFYDPKHKATLPYYDRFPLIFKIEEYPDRFLGINMHYLPYNLRSKLMDALYDTVTNERYDETTRLKISYQILKAASKYKFFKPCIKMYLKSHVKSRFVKVNSSEWDIALFLEVHQFEKASARKVWADSKKAVK